MKNSIWLVLILLLLVVVGGGLYFMNKPAVKNHNIIAPTVAVKQENTNQPESITGSIKTLLTSGRPLTCTFSSKKESVTVSGTVYAAGGKVREDFSSTAPETTMKGHVLVDGKTAYIWNDTNKQGMKFDLTNATYPTPGNSQSPDINQNMNFACQNWSADNSLFTLPAAITFNEINIPAAAGQGINAPASSCAVCDNIPAGPARDTCRTQLNCH